jgi:hypothetical protein
MKAKTKSIPIETVIKMMFKLVSFFTDPNDSLVKMWVKRVLNENGYEYD